MVSLRVMAVQAHPCVPRWVRALWALAALGLCLVACPAGVGAHPLGMASVNRYVGVAPRAVGLELDYLLDLAELPAYAEIERLDGDHDGRVTPAERDRFLDGLVPDIVAALRVTVDGRTVVLREVFRAMEAPPGQSGLSTLRVALTFRATPADAAARAGHAHGHGGRSVSSRPTRLARDRRGRR